jgi:hypothetical protein
MHLDEERIQRLLHVELPQSMEDETRAHLLACVECRALVEVARREEREIHDWLGHLDEPTPTLAVATIVERAERPARAPARLRELARFQRAAALVAALAIAGAAYAAYAAPGSPVRAWITSVVERMTGARKPQILEPVPEPPPGARAFSTDTLAAGIAVAPGRALVILFTTPQSDGGVDVSLTDGAEVEVHGPIDAATYTSDADRLVIDNHGRPATFALEIPRDAPHVEIRVGETRLFLKDGPQVVTSVGADTTAPYRLRLRP